MSQRPLALRTGPGGWLSDVAALLVSLGALAGAQLFVGPERDAAGFLLLPAILLLAGVFAGRLAEWLRLPRLTGYIVIGAVAGPHLAGIVQKTQVYEVKLVEQLAIGLIALMAGAEIRTSWLRARLRSVCAFVAVQSALVPLAIAGVILLTAAWLPFMGEIGALPPLLPALLLGLVLLANSPMVVVSVIKDNRASGPLSETVMGVAVLKDVVVILGFTILVSLIAGVEEGGATAGAVASTGTMTLLHVFLSVVIGLPIGWGLAFATERGVRRTGWLVVGIALGVAMLEPVLHVKPLFCLLTAGFACENLWPRRSALGSHALASALARVAAPVFVIFFVAAGLGLDLEALRRGWIIVLAMVGLRAVLLWTSIRVSVGPARAEEPVRRWLWAGMIPQAGVTLGLAAIIGDRFPGWGESVSDLVVAGVACHELVGPVLLTLALDRSGESGRAGVG